MYLIRSCSVHVDHSCLTIYFKKIQWLNTYDRNIESVRGDQTLFGEVFQVLSAWT